MNRAAIRSILVAGDGIVGRSAALAFARALPGVDVSLLAVAPDPAALAEQIPATLPMVDRFHAAIGFDELDLVRRDIACHHLGTRVDDQWAHSFGTVGRDEGQVPFHQLWLGAHLENGALPFDRYCPASVIGAAGKFVHPSGEPTSPLATYLYGFRLNPRRYRALLVAATDALTCHNGPIARIERRGDGGITAIELADGQSLAADLFVDCTGPRRLLIGRDAHEFDDWSHWLPAREIMLDWSLDDAPAPLDRIATSDDGWTLCTTVPGARLVAAVAHSPAPGSVTIRPGRRRASFVANVLAIGDSAVALNPLLGANLSLAHSAILRAIELLPGRDCNALERGEYNRLNALEADRARDLHILFQHRSDMPSSPDGLARTLGQWRRRGRLPFFEEDMFTPASWAQVLIGTGHLPDHQTPAAGAVDRNAAADAMGRLAHELETLAERLPTYGDYRARMMRAPGQR